MNSEITLVKPQQSNSGTNSTPEWNIYDLYDVWNTGKLYGGKLNVTHMGIYTADAQFLNISFKEATIVRRLNVHGIQLRAMSVVTHSFNSTLEEYLLDHTYNPHLDSMHRFNYRLLSYVREMFNFRWIVYRTNSWGYLKNGTFDGMIGALIRKEIDVGGLVRNVFLQPFTVNVWYCVMVVGIFVIGTTSFISYREANNSVFRGSHSLTNRSGVQANVQSTSNGSKNTENHAKLNKNGDTIAMQSQQQTRRRHQNRKANPAVKKVQAMNNNSLQQKINHEHFRLNVYEYYSGSRNDANKFETAAFDRGQSIALKSKRCNVNSKPTKAFENASRKYDESTLSRCALLFIGALCQQGSSETPQFTSRRCIIMLILLFGFFMFQFYSASIVGSLLLEKPRTIKTLRDLIDSPLKLGIEDILYTRNFFRRTTDPVALELFEKRVKVVNPKTGEISYNFMQPDVGMAKVRQGAFAFHADTATFYKIIRDAFSERTTCELSEIQLFPEQHMMSIVQKRSPLRKMFQYGLRRTFEHGLLYHERKRWHSPKPQCVRQMQPEDLKVSFDTTESAFFILALGISISVSVLLLENAIWFYNKRQQIPTITYLK